MRRIRTPAAAIAVALLVVAATACGSSHRKDAGSSSAGRSATSASGGSASAASTTAVGNSGAGSSATSRSHAGQGNGSTAPSAPTIDRAAETAAIGQVEKFFPPVHGKVSRASYDQIIAATCTAVVQGAAAGRTASATANAIAAAVPPGPPVPQYRSAVLLYSEVYLTSSDCGAPHAYAQAVQKALEPLASKALLALAPQRT